MTGIAFIKSVYWIAAAVDAAVALGMVFPPLIQPVLQIAASPTAVETRYALGTGAALMSGWTGLLIWASVEPVARRGVLLLTAVPVIAGLALSTLYGNVHGYIPRGGALSVWALQGVLVVLLAVAYRLGSLCARAGDSRARERRSPQGELSRPAPRKRCQLRRFLRGRTPGTQMWGCNDEVNVRQSPGC